MAPHFSDLSFLLPPPHQSLLMCARTPHKCDIPSRSLGQAKAVRHAIAENIPLYSLKLLVCSKNLEMHIDVHRQRRQCSLNASKEGRNKRQLPEESSAKRIAALYRTMTHTRVHARQRKVERKKKNPIIHLLQECKATVLRNPRIDISVTNNLIATSLAKQKTGDKTLFFYTDCRLFTAVSFTPPLTPFRKTNTKVLRKT
uniref:Uncharacterized protein n=1 Tax=Rhipicephalus zambeziensis TaxID=60191 RepID=A0A224YBN1_9ACAR